MPQVRPSKRQKKKKKNKKKQKKKKVNKTMKNLGRFFKKSKCNVLTRIGSWDRKKISVEKLVKSLVNSNAKLTLMSESWQMYSGCVRR